MVDPITTVIPTFLTLGSSTVDIFTDDRNSVGSYTLDITAVVDNGEILGAHNFDVEIEDSCLTSTLM